MRAATDSAGTLDNRLIIVTGFTMAGDGDTDLGRVVIICCAAEAQRAARIHLSGPAAIAAASYPEDTWLRIEGTVVTGSSTAASSFVPKMPEDERQDCHQNRPARQHVRLLILAP